MRVHPMKIVRQANPFWWNVYLLVRVNLSWIEEIGGD
jgi:hypothetical protein